MSLHDKMKVGDLISIRQPVRIPLKWWQWPFARWITTRYEVRDVFYTVKTVTDDIADLRKVE